MNIEREVLIYNSFDQRVETQNLASLGLWNYTSTHDRRRKILRLYILTVPFLWKFKSLRISYLISCRYLIKIFPVFSAII